MPEFTKQKIHCLKVKPKEDNPSLSWLWGSTLCPHLTVFEPFTQQSLTVGEPESSVGGDCPLCLPTRQSGCWCVAEHMPA